MTPPKRILLIEPPFLRLFKGTYSLDRLPLSLGYLAGAIKRKKDWDAKAFNASAMRSDLKGLRWSCEVPVQLVDGETVERKLLNTAERKV